VAVRLVPFSPQHLRLNEPLPFGLRDEDGRLLLMAGGCIDSPERLAAMRGQALFSEESESADWHRRLAATMNAMLRGNATVGQLAAARPDQGQREAVAVTAQTLQEQLETLAIQLDAVLRDVRPGGDWMTRLMGVHARARGLAERRFDASLYHLVYTAGQSTEKYCAHHALLTLLICEHAAPLLGWPQPHTDTLGRAALTMNVAMVRLQDLLAQTDLKPTTEMRQQIDNHAAAGAELLLEAGMKDRLCCEVVRLHHDSTPLQAPLNELAPERRLAWLLRRVDIFCAKMSRRRTRIPMSPVQAAREACLGVDGVPDEIGAALLKAVGLYPPGSFVELLNGELGIVIARGRRANLPYVASLVSASGTPLGEPALRDTLDRRYTVKAAVPISSVKVRPPHERLLAMR
jgi:hypothetical protein